MTLGQLVQLLHLELGIAEDLGLPDTAKACKDAAEALQRADERLAHLQRDEHLMHASVAAITAFRTRR